MGKRAKTVPAGTARKRPWRGIGLPLHEDSQVIGMLSLARALSKNFKQAEVTIATNFCLQMVIALRNAEQYHAVQQAHLRETTSPEV